MKQRETSSVFSSSMLSKSSIPFLLLVVLFFQCAPLLTSAQTPSTSFWYQQTPLNSSALPIVRSNQCTAIINGKLYMFGGYSPIPNTDLADFWKYDFSARVWTQLTPSGPQPVARNSQACTSFNGLMYMHGGFCNSALPSQNCNDLFTYNPLTNSFANLTGSLSSPTPNAVNILARNGHQLIVGPNANQILLVAGWGGPTRIEYNDVWSLDTSSLVLTQISAPSAAVETFSKFGCDLSADGTMLFVIKGNSDNAVMSIYSLTLASATWNTLFMLSPPNGRVGLTAVTSGNQFWFWGGAAYKWQVTNDLYSFNTSTNLLAPQLLAMPPNTPLPAPRYFFSASKFFYQSQMQLVIFGGQNYDGSKFFNDLWVLMVPQPGITAATARTPAVGPAWPPSQWTCLPSLFNVSGSSCQCGCGYFDPDCVGASPATTTGCADASQSCDLCGVCGGNSKSCQGCDNIPYSNAQLDVCGVCNGMETAQHTNLTYNTPAAIDYCCKSSTEASISPLCMKCLSSLSSDSSISPYFPVQFFCNGIGDCGDFSDERTRDDGGVCEPSLYSTRIAFFTITSLLIIIAVAILILIIKNRKGAVILFSSPIFCLMMISGSIISYTCVYVWMIRPERVDASGRALCASHLWLPTVSFGLVFGPLLAKTWRIYRIFNATLRSKVGIKNRVLLQYVGAVVLVLVAVLSVWTATGTPTSTYAPVPSTNIDGNEMYPFISLEQVVCSYSGSNGPNFFIFLMLIVAAYLIFGAFLAFKTRNLDSAFSESRSISLCIYTYNIVAMFAVPTIITIHSKRPTQEMIVRCIAWLLLNTVTLWSIFLPKLYIIYREPHRNTSEYLHQSIYREISAGRLMNGGSSSSMSSSSSDVSGGVTFGGGPVPSAMPVSKPMMTPIVATPRAGGGGDLTARPRTTEQARRNLSAALERLDAEQIRQALIRVVHFLDDDACQLIQSSIQDS